jgi:hypothetical protein
LWPDRFETRVELKIKNDDGSGRILSETINLYFIEPTKQAAIRVLSANTQLKMIFDYNLDEIHLISSELH